MKIMVKWSWKWSKNGHENHGQILQAKAILKKKLRKWLEAGLAAHALLWAHVGDARTILCASALYAAEGPSARTQDQILHETQNITSQVFLSPPFQTKQ